MKRSTMSVYSLAHKKQERKKSCKKVSGFRVKLGIFQKDSYNAKKQKAQGDYGT
jgi:hypothetical protein